MELDPVTSLLIEEATRYAKEENYIKFNEMMEKIEVLIKKPPVKATN